MKFFISISILFLLIGASKNAFSHHSIAPHFDTSIEITLEGIVTKWTFVNPHVYVHLDVADAEGTVSNWRCETRAATMLRRTGFSEETLKQGDNVTIIGSPARRDTNHCSISSFIFSRGETVGRFGTLPSHLSATKNSVDTDSTSARTETLANGQPNISGDWTLAPRNGRPVRSQMTVSDAGRSEMEKYEQVYEDPGLTCDIGNIFFGWRRGDLTNIISQQDDKIIIQYGYMDFVRTIYLDRTDHPENLMPSRGGHSIGRWEGDTLVVDTVGFSKGVLHPLSGVPNSTQMHSVERFWYDNETATLNHSYSAEDPLYLLEAYSGQDSMVAADLPYEKYNCTELSGNNNLRPEEQNNP
jgi:hypothetical protein